MQAILSQSWPSCRRQRARASVVMPHSAASPSKKTAALRRSQATGRQSSPAQTRQTQARPCCPLRKKWAAPSTKASEAPARAARPFHLPGWGHARGAASICMLPSILPPACLAACHEDGLPVVPRCHVLNGRISVSRPILPQRPPPGCARSHMTAYDLLFRKNMWDGMMTKSLAQQRTACSIPQNGTVVWYLHAKWGRTGSPAGLSPSVS